MQNKDRRQFIKNTSLAALSLGFLPFGSKANTQETMACEETTQDYYGVGPFYSENPPDISDGQLAKESEEGTRMIISGRVMNLDCTEAIPNAIVDIWHADHNGDYDNVGYNLRGKVKTNSQGFYSFETIKPGKYLNGAEYRPSHIHFKITPPGKDTLVTQLYFKGDTSIANDAAASITSGTFNATHRIIELTTNNDGKLEGTWDIVLDAEGKNIGTNDLYLDKGIIYTASPNPFSERLEIKYGVFLDAVVGLDIYDIQGRLVANLESRELKAQKYEAVWEPEPGLPDGNYFVALKVNDLQVQYKKVVRKH
ncbi:MAG: T9SS type A sorting domain-containing protein [Bacteroidia bacterium]|nr:T9SS type A sorting domain-containing protein [Bacteroidia bacterium]